MLELRDKVSLLIDDVNDFAVAVWAATPHDIGWAEQEPVVSLTAAINADLDDLREYLGSVLEDAGYTFDPEGGWTNPEPITGPTTYLEEFWMNASAFKLDVFPTFLSTTGSQTVISYYENGASTASPCGVAFWMQEAVEFMVSEP